MTVHQFPNKKPAAMASGYEMKNKGNNRGEIWLYGPIGADYFGEGISAKTFKDDLKRLGAVKDIDLHINSEGGSVLDARAIYTLLQGHGARITSHIDGFAASAASFIAMVGNVIIISEGAFVMIHNARAGTYGESEDHRKTADLLDKVNDTIRDVYVARTGNDKAKVKKWMDAETWFTGKEALEAGFADSMVENKKMAAMATSLHRPEMFRNLPLALRPDSNRAKAAAIMARSL